MTDQESTRKTTDILDAKSVEHQWSDFMKTFVNTPRICALVAAVFIVNSGSVFAKDVKVSLTGSEETPPVTTSASANGTISIKADKTVSGSIKTSGIDGTMAHIHVGAPGASGPPIITLEKTADGVWSIPAGANLTDEQYASFKAGNLYVNVHSAEHKPGEIRAQLKP
jgi:CHRD domain